MLRRLLPLLLLFSATLLAGCDQLGIESASAVAARQEADGKAVGAACRHAGRAIEDCFALNRRIEKAAIYGGWREMDDYMRENKLDTVAPVLGPGTTKVADAEAAPAAEAAASKGTAGDKAEAKPDAKDDGKVDAKAGPKADAKADARTGAKAESKVDPKTDRGAKADKTAKSTPADPGEKVAARDSGMAADKASTAH